MSGSGYAVGGMVASGGGNSFTNCNVQGSIMASGWYIGGLIGHSHGDYISNVGVHHIDVKNESNFYTGVIVGYAQEGGEFDGVSTDNCNALSQGFLGGIAGHIASAQMNNVSSACTLTTVNGGVCAGIAGEALNTSITNSSFTTTCNGGIPTDIGNY